MKRQAIDGETRSTWEWKKMRLGMHERIRKIDQKLNQSELIGLALSPLKEQRERKVGGLEVQNENMESQTSFWATLSWKVKQRNQKRLYRRAILENMQDREERSIHFGNMYFWEYED